MLRFGLILGLAFLTGCEGIHQHRLNYCEKTATSITKKMALKAIHIKYPGYPAEGICTGLDLGIQ
jgi:hypothetical protein